MRKRVVLTFFVALLALPVASARAGNLCTAIGWSASSTFCSLESSTALLPGQPTSPSFLMVGHSGMLFPVARANPLNFGATFPVSRGLSSTEPVSMRVSSQAGRQLSGEGGGGVSGGVGVSLNGAPDGWFRGSPADGGTRFRLPYNPNLTGYVYGSDPAPLDETPEPLTLALFGTGLLLIALVVRRQHSLSARGEQ